MAVELTFTKYPGWETDLAVTSATGWRTEDERVAYYAAQKRLRAACGFSEVAPVPCKAMAWDRPGGQGLSRQTVGRCRLNNGHDGEHELPDKSIFWEEPHG